MWVEVTGCCLLPLIDSLAEASGWNGRSVDGKM